MFKVEVIEVIEEEEEEEEEENLCPKKYHETHTHVYLNVTDRKERYLTLINTQNRHFLKLTKS